MCRLRKIAAIGFILLSCEHKDFLNPFDPLNLPPAPELIAPANDVVCSQNPPYFHWDVEEDTLNPLYGEQLIYCIQIGNNPDFSSIIYADSSYSDKSFLPYTLFNEGAHFWRVKAKYQNGGWGKWSETRSLKVRFPLVGTSSVYAQGEMAINQNAIYLASGSKIYIIDITNPENPQPLSTYNDSTVAFDHIFIANNYLYTTYTNNFAGKLSVYNVIDPSRPMLVSRFTLNHERTPSDLWINGNKAYVCTNDQTLIIDVSNPDSLTVIDSLAVTGNIIISRNYAYLLKAYTISIVDLANNNVVTSIICNCNSMSISGSNLYLAGNRISIYDISNPANPVLIATINENGYAVCANNFFLFFIQYGNDGLLVYDVMDPANPKELGSVENVAGGIVADNNFVYISQPVFNIIKYE